MFYYISFLRPPPSQTSPSGFILITPQIANDLRTEPFAGTQEIYYAWSLHPNAGENGLLSISKPQKLTVWRESSAYKEIRVPLPEGVREGQTYRLHLTAFGHGFPHVINLAGVNVGQRPFPVMSMPILFSARPVKGKDGAVSTWTGKQEQIERVYRVPIGMEEQVFLRVMEQTSFDLDKKIWDSGIGLSSWLVELFSDISTAETQTCESVSKLKDKISAQKHCNILELGTGTGIVSLTLGALRSGHGLTEGCILTTDLPSAMPLLQHNISANEKAFHSSGTHPHAVVLDWDEELLPDAVSAVREDLDIIIMADVTYNTASFPSLIRTLSTLTHPTEASKPLHSPLIVLGYKERDPSERTLWDLVQEIGIHFKRVSERKGAGGEPVEFWIGQLDVLGTGS